MKKRLALILVVVPLLVGCATNPVTGKSELSLIPEPQEIAMGQQGAEQIISQMGLYPDEGLQTYVSDLGMDMARGSERPHLPWIVLCAGRHVGECLRASGWLDFRNARDSDSHELGV